MGYLANKNQFSTMGCQDDGEERGKLDDTQVIFKSVNLSCMIL